VSTASTRRAEKNWAITVARAEPPTPQPQATTKISSSARFTTEEKTRKYRGRFESPTARRMPAPML
jgi:hypothetical protein